MAKQGKQWNGATSVGCVLLVLALLFVLLPTLIDPYHSLLYVGTRNNARRASCQSNLDQLGLAMIQYSQENDGALPCYAAADGRGWRETLYPYVRSVGIYRCPDDERDRSYDSDDNLPKSYSANTAIMTGSHLSTLSSLEQIIAAVDTRGYNGEDWNTVNPAFLPDTGRGLYAHVPTHLFYEHPTGAVNFLFADGHIKAMQPAATLTPVNLWTRDNAPFTGQDLANARAILTHAENE